MSNKEICTYCGGAGGYVSTPEYTPFDFRRCRKCNGTGEITPQKKEQTLEDKKAAFRNMVKRNPDLF